MIDIRQLRIGSHVSFGGKRVTVDEILTVRPEGHPIKLTVSCNGTVAGFPSIEDVEPIKITPALLEELGFEQRRREYPYGMPAVWYIDHESAQLEKEHGLVVAKTAFFPLSNIGCADWWVVKALVGEKPMRDDKFTCQYLHEAEAFLALHGVELIND